MGHSQVDHLSILRNTIGNAVNASDVVVGNIIDHGPDGTSEGRLDAFLWRNGNLIDIAQGTADGGAQATATGINNRGDVVGSYDAGPFVNFGYGFGISHAYLYRNGILTDIGTLGGYFSFGSGINNAGQVIGTSSETPGFEPPEDSYKAFLYSNGKMQAIGGAQSNGFTPKAINDHGWIAGTLGGNPVTAVLWINNRIISLGTLPGFSGSESVSINNRGVVIGNLLGNITVSTYDPPYTYVAVLGFFIYEGKMHNLNDLVDGNWKITAVAQINDAGQIAATGVKPGSAVTYALLLTPESREIRNR